MLVVVLEERTQWIEIKDPLFQNGNVFPLISGGKVALNRGSGLRRFNATFPPDIKGKTLYQVTTTSTGNGITLSSGPITPKERLIEAYIVTR